jgi:hypothetical protein
LRAKIGRDTGPPADRSSSAGWKRNGPTQKLNRFPSPGRICSCSRFRPLRFPQNSGTPAIPPTPLPAPATTRRCPTRPAIRRSTTILFPLAPAPAATQSANRLNLGGYDEGEPPWLASDPAMINAKRITSQPNTAANPAFGLTSAVPATPRESKTTKHRLATTNAA